MDFYAHSGQVFNRAIEDVKRQGWRMKEKKWKKSTTGKTMVLKESGLDKWGTAAAGWKDKPTEEAVHHWKRQQQVKSRLSESQRGDRMERRRDRLSSPPSLCSGESCIKSMRRQRKTWEREMRRASLSIRDSLLRKKRLRVQESLLMNGKTPESWRAWKKWQKEVSQLKELLREKRANKKDELVPTLTWTSWPCWMRHSQLWNRANWCHGLEDKHRKQLVEKNNKEPPERALRENREPQERALRAGGNIEKGALWKGWEHETAAVRERQELPEGGLEQRDKIQKRAVISVRVGRRECSSERRKSESWRRCWW